MAPDPSPEVWRHKVRELEDSPVDVLLVNDHLTGLRYAPMVALAAAAERSTRLRLGTIVLAHDYRHPAILAKEAATLDLHIVAGWLARLAPYGVRRRGVELITGPAAVSRVPKLLSTKRLLDSDAVCHRTPGDGGGTHLVRVSGLTPAH